MTRGSQAGCSVTRTEQTGQEQAIAKTGHLDRRTREKTPKRGGRVGDREGQSRDRVKTALAAFANPMARTAGKNPRERHGFFSPRDRRIFDLQARQADTKSDHIRGRSSMRTTHGGYKPTMHETHSSCMRHITRRSDCFL